MPKFDVIDQQVIIDFQIPNPPLTLHDCKSDEDIALYIKQELKKISETAENYLIKEMMKEDLYEKVAPKIKNLEHI
jgi:hypothetical protein